MPSANRLARSQPFSGPEAIGNQLLDGQEREVDILWRIASCDLDHLVQISLRNSEEREEAWKDLEPSKADPLKSVGTWTKFNEKFLAAAS